MKQMTKLLLIHWHYFAHELIEFSKINFLTGKNASGKSTIIDALQLLLLADTSGNFFNKAANGKSARTLSGYLRGELGDDVGSGFRCLRDGRFTSYICAEFYDDIKDNYFTAGCCFDYYSENDIPKLFFYFDGTIPQHEFIENETPMDIRGLRQYLNNTYSPNHKYTTETNRDFRDKLYGKLGGLPQKFSSLLKKAVPFNPIADIQQFITEFVCDEQQNIDISLMQENIRNYKSLEDESSKLQIRIKSLENINETYDRYREFAQQEQLYNYLIDRSQLEIKERTRQEKRELILNNTHLIEEKGNVRDGWILKREKLNDECNAKIADLKSDGASLTIDRLEAQKQSLIQDIQTISKNFEHYQNLLANTLSDWKNRVKAQVKIDEFDQSVFEPALAERILGYENSARQFEVEAEKVLSDHGSSALISVGQEKLEALAEKGRIMGHVAYELRGRLEDEQSDTAKIIREEKQELEQLQKGVYRYPRFVNDLREAILSELQMQFGLDVHVDILAQLIEIKSDRWRNTIEGYMNSQKLYLLVNPEHFQMALDIYNRVKKQKNIYGVRLIDIDRIQKRNPICQPNSLAEEIETDNPFARLYINYLLGRVIKCDQVSELRKYQVAVTDEGMLYQGYTVGRIDPKTWETPAIGQSAIQRKILYIKQHLSDMDKLLSACTTAKLTIHQMTVISGFSDSDITQTISTAKKYQTIPQLQVVIQKINTDLSAIDTNRLTALKKLIEELQTKIKDCEKEIDNLNKLITGLEVAEENAGDLIPKIEKEILKMQSKIQKNYPQDWIDDTGDAKFLYERNVKKSFEEIEQNFYSPLMKATKNKAEQWSNLHDFRRDYVGLFKVGYDIDSQENMEFENAWLELSEIKLPEYQTKIEDARHKAFEQFQEDFLSRLQSNIQAAETQIKQLNDAIRVNFGEDTYRFKIIPKEEYRRYYDMITSDMLLNGYNLLSNQFNETYKEEIAELFSLITTPGAGGQDDYHKRVREFTNYRTYLSFDLEVIDQEGNSQRLSRTF